MYCILLIADRESVWKADEFTINWKADISLLSLMVSLSPKNDRVY